MGVSDGAEQLKSRRQQSFPPFATALCWSDASVRAG
jgi:hypothetical protein